MYGCVEWCILCAADTPREYGNTIRCLERILHTVERLLGRYYKAQ